MLRLRHQYSSMNSDLFRINITNNPKWQCDAPLKVQFIKNIETLLFGDDEIDIDDNSMIFNKVPADIRQTKYF